MTASMNLNPLPGAKQVYVGSVRLAQPFARRLGLIDWLNAAAAKKRWAHWARSLFAIHDIDGLIELDVPWWTYGAIDRISKFLDERQDARVFEFGSGASTVWLARRAGTVISVEHDTSWYSLVNGLLADLKPRASLSHTCVEAAPASAETDPIYLSEKPGYRGISFETYARSILQADGLFDVIVVDGRARGACLHHAVEKLAAGGMIVFDNSKRRRYREAINSCGLDAARYTGLTPSLPYSEETTILTHRPGQTRG